MEGMNMNWKSEDGMKEGEEELSRYWGYVLRHQLVFKSTANRRGPDLGGGVQ